MTTAEIMSYVGTALGSSTVMGLATWWRFYRKDNAETHKTIAEAEKLRAETEITIGEAWKKFAEQVNDELEETKKVLEETQTKINELKQQLIQEQKGCLQRIKSLNKKIIELKSQMKK